MKTVNLPPFAPTLMESTRSIGYSIEAAIADIIDNSIAAEASMIDLDFFPIDAYISILDDGYGMDEEALQLAMQYGSKNPLDIRENNDLGRYGLGLKTASLSQCRKLTVISKQDCNIVGMRWDLDHVIASEKWSLIILEEDEFKEVPNFKKLEEKKTGTLVVWQDLDKFSIGESDIETAFSNKMSITREHLSLVFHRFLSGEPGLKKINIFMNGLSIEPQDPFLLGKSTQLMDEEVVNIRGSAVKIKPYILPHISNLTKDELDKLGGKDGLRKSQGFYVYRNKRLLVWGTWFRLMRQGDLSKLARVQVDIPNSLDDLWTLDIKKSTATPPDEVKQNLKIIIEKIASGSKRTWTYRGKKETKDSIVHIWNAMNIRGSKYYSINRDHPIVTTFIDKYPESKKLIDVLLKEIETNIPLNSLYIDLTGDQKIENDTEQSFVNIRNTLKVLLANLSPEERTYLLDNYLCIEPFCNYEDEIKDAINKGDL